MTIDIVVPVRRNLRGLELIRGTRYLLSEPDKMEEKTGIEGANYNQRRPGYKETPDDQCDGSGCLVAWMAFLSGLWNGGEAKYHYYDVAFMAGLSKIEIRDLFWGYWDRWGEPDPANGGLLDRTNAAAVRVLDRLIAEQEAKQAQIGALSA